MEENNKSPKMSLEQLQKRRKMLIIIVITLSIITVISLAVFSYSIFKNQTFSSIPLGVLSVALMFSSVYLIKIETEIKSRNL